MNLTFSVYRFGSMMFDERERLDCSQSSIFSCDRLDIPRLTVTAILIFKGTEGAGVGDYSSSGGGALPPKPPPPPK